MQRTLLVVFLLFGLLVYVTSPAWAGGLDDAKAGEAAIQGRRYDEAIRLYTKAIESGELSREHLAIAYYNRGLAWSGKGNYDNAIVDYTKAIEINPRYANAYYNRGNVWYGKGDNDKAIADLTKAIELNPKDADAHYNRGVVWEAKGDNDKAKADYDKAREIDPSIR